MDRNGADSVLNFSSGFDVIFAGQYSFIATKDMTGASGLYTIRAYFYDIYTLSWSDNGGWSIIPSKRIKGKRASWATSGALVFTDFDYMPNVAQNVYQSILLVTEVID